MKKFVLIQYNDIKSEITDLQDRIRKIESKGYVISDSVKGSSNIFPYTIQNYKATGFDDISINKVHKLESILKEKCDQLIDLNIEAEEFLKNVDDSEIRQILRYKYIDDKNWIQISNDMNYLYKKDKYTPDSVRMKHDRFLKKL